MDRGEGTFTFIGKLAMALYTYGVTIYWETLQKILQDKGVYDGDGVDIAHVVAAASRYWEDADPATHHAIASTFLGPHDVSLVEAPQEFATV